MFPNVVIFINIGICPDNGHSLDTNKAFDVYSCNKEEEEYRPVQARLRMGIFYYVSLFPQFLSKITSIASKRFDIRFPNSATPSLHHTHTHTELMHIDMVFLSFFLHELPLQFLIAQTI